MHGREFSGVALFEASYFFVGVDFTELFGEVYGYGTETVHLAAESAAVDVVLVPIMLSSSLLGSGIEFSPSTMRTRHSAHVATPPQMDFTLRPFSVAIFISDLLGSTSTSIFCGRNLIFILGNHYLYKLFFAGFNYEVTPRD